MKKNNIFLIIFIVLTLLFNCIILLKNDFISFDKQFIVRYSIFSLIVILLFNFILRKKIDIKKYFIFIYVVLGFLYLFSFPINSLPDEDHHFYRSYEITKGRLMSEKQKKEKGYIGVVNISDNIAKVSKVKPTYKTNIDFKNIKDNHKNFRYVELTNISLYSFICYIPQAFGVFIGKFLHLPIIYWEFLARICNFLLFSLLLKFSLDHIPYKKSTLMFIALLPMTFQIAISMSADCMTMGVSIALISYVLELISKPNEKINKKDYIIVTILSLVLALCKIIYLPICLLMFFIPETKFVSKKEKFTRLGLIFLLVLIANLSWLSLASQYLAALNNSDLQLKYILCNPLKYLYIIINTIIENSKNYLYMFYGSSLGTYKVNLSSIYIDCIFVVNIILILFDTENDKIDKSIKYGSLFIFMMVFGLMATSLYLDWTPYMSNLIEGIQGRYFLPVSILVPMIFSTNWFNLKNKKYLNCTSLILLMIIINLYSLTMISMYY